MSPASNRRDFLTGKAAHRELRQAGDEIADALLEAVPVAGDTLRLETRAMACQWAVVMNPGPTRQVMTASDALDLVHACEDQLTVYRDDSFIARINREAAVSPQPLPSDLFALLARCRQLWEETDGAFDLAAGALVKLWRTCRLRSTVPSQAEIARALSQSGSQHWRLNEVEQSISFDVPGLSLDFGAIGKGYALDRVGTHLKREGIESFLIHGGYSSMFAAGTHGKHDGWPVGIRNPLFTERMYATVLLRDEGFSTSGSNVQFFRHQGERYGHILDPRTGRPASGLLSVSVIAPTAESADALSTAFYVMGLDNAVRYCEDHPEVGAILVPPPDRGPELVPVVRNIPPERMFWAERQVSKDD